MWLRGEDEVKTSLYLMGFASKGVGKIGMHGLLDKCYYLIPIVIVRIQLHHYLGSHSLFARYLTLSQSSLYCSIRIPRRFMISTFSSSITKLMAR